MSEDLRRHRLRELGAASRTGLPHALRSDLAVETERLSLEERLPHPVGRGLRNGPARTSKTSAAVREVRSVRGSAAGGADAFEARAGTKTGEQGRRVSDTVCHFRLVGFHVGPLRGEIPPAATTIPIPSRKHCSLSHGVPRVPFGPFVPLVLRRDPRREGRERRTGREGR